MHDEARKLEAIDTLLTAARELLASAELRDDERTAEIARRGGRHVVVVDAASPFAPHIRIDLVAGCGDDTEAVTRFQYSTAPGFFEIGDSA
jgi:hypothetical protein